MRPLYIIFALLPIFVMGVEDTACNCEHCDEERVIGLEEEMTTTTTSMYKEEDDNDGNRTICARSRDFNDRTFPSVCYMLCYNRCTRYRMMAVQENDVKKYIMIAYRPMSTTEQMLCFSIIKILHIHSTT
ncbi:uncharacterized protein LOC105426959 isoform X3 [Pogonomyrmex barbatus]|uniref:Uncharacterized protein LOC105426959 isoform X3 n=1 Tax=Pogonomyrmex barbatus TaxID=144034 RepID=A0A6I9W475_9HYME|nr:uncharacterized protein LOC105426959 isoform X3 [Pogonomyrmex barbatus]